jgi:aspartate kinase
LVAVPGTVVMKFGGTSVANAERLKRAARRIVAQRRAGRRVVAVISARGSTTDELTAMAEEVSPRPDPREMDMLLSTGERISCALCAMAIKDLGHRAISMTGSQAGIVTDTSHTKARILEVRADRIKRALDDDHVVLVAGFQGVSTAYDVTTLGRGGSDTTAVAVAAAVGADVCEIYTDVAGVYSADPRIVPGARRLAVLSFEEMLEMAASGAKVLQLRAVEYARNHGVRIHCRSAFDDGPGTVVLSESDTMERPLITAVTHSTDEARVTLLGVPDRPGVAGGIFSALADANVNVDMIVQNEPVSEGARADISFTVPRSDLPVARATLEPMVGELMDAVATDPEMGTVSIIGAGMKSHPGVAAKVFRTIGDEGINIEMISTSPIKISCVIDGSEVARAVRILHDAFELGGQVRAEQPFGAPALNSARSNPSMASSASPRTTRPPSSSRPTERSEAKGTTSAAGKARWRRTSRMTEPTLPVAPTTATR